MKKSIYLILSITILFVIFTCNIANADMGAPMIEPYTAYVLNPNGAEYYETKYSENDVEYVVKGKLEYNAPVKITYETEEDSGYVAFQKSEGDYTNYYVKVSDLAKVSIPNNDYNKSSKRDAVVLAKDGVELHIGPGNGYETLGVVIPKETKLTVYEATNYGTECPWFYTSYNGNSGWICFLNGTVGFKSEYYDEFVTPGNMEIYSKPHGDEVVAVIPGNTHFTEFLAVDQWSTSFYVTYNGVSGYISSWETATPINYDSDYEIHYNNCKIYEKAVSNSNVLLENIPVGTKITPEYITDVRATGWLYGTYNGVSGWIFYSETEEYLNDIDTTEPELKEITLPETETNVETENVIENNFADSSDVVTSSLNTNALIGICIGGAVIVALMAFIIMCLVNENKKLKKEDK